VTEVTQILRAVQAGDPAASEQLLPLVYDELRALARRKMAGERADHTLQATALVHEAYLRLVGDAGEEQGWDGRAHFFAAAAEAMRRILIDNARRKHRLRHGGQADRVELDEQLLAIESPPEDVLALDEALVKLAAEDHVKAELVKLRYFAGLTLDDAARMLGISPVTADRYWAFARAWLYRELKPDD
jgi:RNA polymerase sigma factor (TIGR02999 family)